jgi:ribonuclease D
VYLVPNEDGESYCAKTMDLSTLARSAGCEIPGRLSLEKLSVSFLGLRIKKDPRIRLSAWSKPQLTKEQVRYACIDAIVSIKIYNEIISSMSPLLKQAPTSESAVVGRSVWLLAPKENTPVAFGIVQAQPSEKWSNTQLAFKTKNCERVVVKVDKVLRGNYICPFVQE